MCGIGGFWKRTSNSIEYSSQINFIKHRGIDSQITWFNPLKNVCLEHTLLNINSSISESTQPFHVGTLSIVFNGEIYNHLELRKKIINLGYQLKSYIEAEILLKGFQIWGIVGLLNQIDGMFAITIWDELNQEMYCARDRYGEKPFFYTFQNSNFIFSSEIKGIKNIIKTSLNRKRFFYYLVWNVIEPYPERENTFYNEIKRLAPGHYLRISKSKCEIKSYYTPQSLQTFSSSFEMACEYFKEMLNNSLKLRLQSQFPIGISLSGGLDSASLLALYRKNSTQEINIFSARFNQYEKDEGFYMEKALSTSSNFKWHQVWIEETDFINNLESTFYSQDEPFNSASVVVQHTLMKYIHENSIKIIIDGQGADEILGGYSSYFIKKNRLPSYSRQFISGIKRKVLGHKGFNKDFINEFAFASHPLLYTSNFHEELKFDLQFGTLAQLLRYSDRNSMRYGIEVRLPFLSHLLIDGCLSLPEKFLKTFPTKNLLRMAMKDNLHPAIYSRMDKIAYETPQEKWLQNRKIQELIKNGRELLKNEKIINDSYVINDWQALMMHFLYNNT